MERFWLFGKNGKITKVLENSEVNTEEITPPLIEIETFFCMPATLSEHEPAAGLRKPLESALIKAVTPAYKYWNKFGPWGDIIQVTVTNGSRMMIDFIGRLAFHKPGLAADLVPIIVDQTGTMYFIGIERKDTHGVPALIGGHLDIKGYHMETPAQALLHEAAEEANFKIIPAKNELERIQTQPDADNISVLVELGDQIQVESKLQRLGRFQTSAEEQMKSLQLKRVYETIGYGLRIDLAQSLNISDINEWFQAGDDAKSMQIWNITKNGPPQKFAFEHHRTIFFSALRKLID
ncbi:hypothetical protein ACFL2U_01275 [Patescibacteria group bacterium]